MWPALFFALFLQVNSSVDVASISEFLRAGDFESALRQTKAAVQVSPNDPRVWTLQGLAYQGIGQSTEALNSLKHAVRVKPDYLPALKAQAQIEYSSSDPHAGETLQRLVQLEPNEQVSHAMLGALAYGRRDCSAAVAQYKQSEQVIQSDTNALHQYAECLLRQEEAGPAAAIYRRLAENSSDSKARYRLAQAELALGQTNEASNDLQPLLQIKPVEPHVNRLAAMIYEKTGDTPKAVFTLRDAIVQDPANEALYLDFVDLCFAHRSYQAGVEMVTAGLKQLPKSAKLRIARGILLIQLGKFDEAESEFALAEQIDPRQAYTSVAKSIADLQAGDPAQSLPKVEQRIRREPNNSYLHYVRAEILMRQGVDPGTPQFQQAVGSAKRAVQLQPNFPLAEDLLGSLYLKQNQLSLAMQSCKSALAHDPDNVSALYHLMTATKKAGRTEEATALMRQFAQMKEDQNKKDQTTRKYHLVGEAEAAQAQTK